MISRPDQTAPAGAGALGNIQVAQAICRVFWGQFVGFHVGFLGIPDTHLISAISELEVICRVCRVFLGVESSGEFRALIRREPGSGVKPLLHDVVPIQNSSSTEMTRLESSEEYIVKSLDHFVASGRRQHGS